MESPYQKLSTYRHSAMVWIISREQAKNLEVESVIELQEKYHECDLSISSTYNDNCFVYSNTWIGEAMFQIIMKKYAPNLQSEFKPVAYL